MMHIGSRERPPLVHIMMHIGRRERLPLVPIMMLTRSREKCLLGLIMMPTRRGDRHHFTVMHTRSIYQTEIFQEVPLLYPEGKMFHRLGHRRRNQGG